MPTEAESKLAADRLVDPRTSSDPRVLAEQQRAADMRALDERHAADLRAIEARNAGVVADSVAAHSRAIDGINTAVAQGMSEIHERAVEIATAMKSTKDIDRKAIIEMVEKLDAASLKLTGSLGTAQAHLGNRRNPAPAPIYPRYAPIAPAEVAPQAMPLVSAVDGQPLLTPDGRPFSESEPARTAPAPVTADQRRAAAAAR